MNQRDYAADLGALGYPGFSYVKGLTTADPGELLLSALNEPDLDSRIVEGLPWVVWSYVEIDWSWLVEKARLTHRQNRLGFLVSVATELAQRTNKNERVPKLQRQLEILEMCRLSERPKRTDKILPGTTGVPRPNLSKALHCFSAFSGSSPIDSL